MNDAEITFICFKCCCFTIMLSIFEIALGVSGICGKISLKLSLRTNFKLKIFSQAKFISRDFQQAVEILMC